MFKVKKKSHVSHINICKWINKFVRADIYKNLNINEKRKRLNWRLEMGVKKKWKPLDGEIERFYKLIGDLKTHVTYAQKRVIKECEENVRAEARA